MGKIITGPRHIPIEQVEDNFFDKVPRKRETKTKDNTDKSKKAKTTK
jgi:hypothetical protein